MTELYDAEVDHRGGEIGEAHPAPACLVTPEGDAAPVLQSGEQVLDVVTSVIQLGMPFGRVDHASLGRRVDGAAIRGEGGMERSRDGTPVKRCLASSAAARADRDRPTSQSTGPGRAGSPTGRLATCLIWQPGRPAATTAGASAFAGPAIGG